MIIKKIPISKIEPVHYNPRLDLKPGDVEYEKIKRSIEEFDLVEPLVWNEYNKRLIGGHQRLKVLKEKGQKDVQVSCVNIKEENREKALNIALNKVQGDWDFPKLKEILVNLDDGQFDLTLTGFDHDELKEMVDWGGKHGLTDEDDAPDIPKKAITKHGDKWELGNHVLVCRDMLEHLNLNHEVSLIVTDPPYGVAFGKRNLNLKAKEWGEIRNDSMEEDEYEKWIRQCFMKIQKDMLDPFCFYVWSAPLMSGYRLSKALMDSGLHIQSQIVWCKNVFNLGQADYQWNHEICWYGYKGKKHIWNGERDKRTTWHINKDSNQSYKHPTQKPVEIYEMAIKNSSMIYDTVIDPFCGSGSCFIACEKRDRSCYGIEIEPKYCDVTIERWENFTGGKAKRITNA